MTDGTTGQAFAGAVVLEESVEHVLPPPQISVALGFPIGTRIAVHLPAEMVPLARPRSPIRGVGVAVSD